MTVRPKIILHNALSLDGWLDGFNADIGLYYETAGSLGAGAILSGSTTILTGFADAPEEDDPEPRPVPPDVDTRPLLVVVDGRGRVRLWDRIRRQPYWRDVIALYSRSTPRAARDQLAACGVEAIVAGERRVDLARAMALLAERHAVRVVRVDSGGRLNAALLRSGLADEVSLLLHPVVVGPNGRHRLFAGPASAGLAPLRLEAVSVESLRGGIAWVRGRVVATDESLSGP